MNQELPLKTQIELDEIYYGSSDAVSSDESPFVLEQLAQIERLTEELLNKGYVADDY